MPLFDDRFTTAEIDTGGARIHVRHNGAPDKPPLLLMHGYPETHAAWHRVAPLLADDYHLVMPDLRGYGDSSKPATTPDHSPYAKRAMAQDMVAVMAALGHERFRAAGHDRGGRVLHRLCLDHPQRVQAACLMDIAPTLTVFEQTDEKLALRNYHWFFMMQERPLPERMLHSSAEFYVLYCLRRWSGKGVAALDEEAVAEYLRCYNNRDTIHATCEDYRASGAIDRHLDQADRDEDQRIECPLLVLWGRRAFTESHYDMLKVWRDYARNLSGASLDCGHFLPEEAPDEVAGHLRRFFDANP